MDIKKLQRAIVDGLEDVKAQDILVFDTERLSPLFERVIIASGTSNRQTKALASSVRETVKKRGMQVMRTEGEDNGEWIIVDCGAAVVHVMQPAIRQYYHLEEIWGGKPVKLKLGDSGTRLVKASEPMDEEDEDGVAVKKPAGKSKAKAAASAAAPAKKAPSRTAGTKAAAAKADGKATAGKSTGKAGAKSAAKPAGKVAAKTASKAPSKVTAKTGTKATGTAASKTAAAKPAARKTAGRSAPKEVIAQTIKVGAKKPAAKKAVAAKPAAKSAAKPATKAAAKPAAKKPAARKTTVTTGTKSKPKTKA